MAQVEEPTFYIAKDSEVLEPYKYFDNETHVMKFHVKYDENDAPYTGNITIRMVRRGVFEKGQSIWLCPEDKNCTNNATKRATYSIYGPFYVGNTFHIFYNGADLKDIPTFVIKVCKNSCEYECPWDCGGRGACVETMHICYCDEGFRDSGFDCVSESGIDGVMLCMILALVVIAVIVFIIVFFLLCCLCPCCPIHKCCCNK